MDYGLPSYDTEDSVDDYHISNEPAALNSEYETTQCQLRTSHCKVGSSR